METKPINVRAVPIELWKRLKIRAVEDNSTIAEVLAKAIQAYLERAA